MIHADRVGYNRQTFTRGIRDALPVYELRMTLTNCTFIAMYFRSSSAKKPAGRYDSLLPSLRLGVATNAEDSWFDSIFAKRAVQL